MARKMRLDEELAFVQATRFTELTFGREHCRACPHWSIDHLNQTETQMTDAVREEFMLDEGLFLDEWF